MAIDPVTAKIASDIGKGVFEGSKSELKREGTNYKELFQYLRSMPKELIVNTITIGPKFILLLIKMLKSKEKDTGLKLLFSGMIIALSVGLGFMIWDISAIALFFGTWGLLGPASAIGGIVFGSLVLFIKSALTAFLVLISMLLCNMLFTTEELNELAKEAFGETEGKSFMEKYNSIIKSVDSGIEKFIYPIKNFFIKLGERKIKKDGNLNFDDIEEKIKVKSNIK
jgi:hypothetical protein